MGLHVAQGFGASFTEANYSSDHRCNLHEFAIYVKILHELYFCFITLYDVLLSLSLINMVPNHEIL